MRRVPYLAAEGGNVVRVVIADDASPYLDPSFVEALVPVVAEAAARRPKAIVLEGSARYFSAGASRESLLGADSRAEVARYVREIPEQLLSLPAPVIAAMEGHAIGGGLLMGLWCDVVYLARESLYGANFMSLGFTPGMGSTRLLEAYFGRPLARELLFGGSLVKGREIEAAGVPASRYVVAKREVRDRAHALADGLAEAPGRALALLKGTLAALDRSQLVAAVRDEQAMHGMLLGREETRREIRERYGLGVEPAASRSAGG